MPVEPDVAVRPITSADIDDVSRFLHDTLNSRLSARDWAAAMVPPWSGDFPNHGFMLTAGGQVVGANLAFYSVRTIQGQREAFCNLGALCVREEFRGHTFRLVRSLLKQPGYHFTDLSPSGSVVELNRRLGFRELDTTTALVANLPWVGGQGARLVADLDEIDRLLSGEARAIFHDHRHARAARHLLIVHGENQCYVLFRKDRRKKLRLFASLLYVSDKDLYRSAAHQVARHLLLRHGALVCLVEPRVVGFRPALSYLLGTPRTKMYKSSRLSDGDIDYLYSELTCVAW